MPGRRPFSELLEGIQSDPERWHQTLQCKRAIEVSLALGRLLDCNVADAGCQPNISRIEHEEDIYLSTLREYVAALGGELEINVVFPDRKVRLEPAE
jgi:hypothetical protein